MKSIALLTLVVVLLAGCSGKPDIPPNNLLVPNYLCTQTPTGKTRMDTRMTYCGRGCSRPQDYRQYAVDVECKYTDWRNE